MATENIVLLGSAVVLCTLHLLGGPLSGLVRKPRSERKSDAPVVPPPSRSSASLSQEVTSLSSEGRVL
jgi:hypothetical protein